MLLGQDRQKDENEEEDEDNDSKESLDDGGDESNVVKGCISTRTTTVQ